MTLAGSPPRRTNKIPVKLIQVAVALRCRPSKGKGSRRFASGTRVQSNSPRNSLPVRLLPVSGEVSGRAAKQGARADGISAGMMVQRYRYLDQPLQKLLLAFWGGPPNVLEHFMGLEEGGSVEQLDSLQIALRVHA